MRKMKNKLTLIAMACMLGASVPTMAQVNGGGVEVGKGKGWGDHVLVPYVDVEDSSMATLKDLTLETSITRYNLGFMVANKEGNLVWLEDRLTKQYKDLDKNVASALKELRTIGADGKVSFGGPTGTALYEVESSVDALVSAYQRVIDVYGLTAVDFYMSGNDFSRGEKQAIKRNIDALDRIQKKNPNLNIWVTFEIDYTGMDSGVKESITYIEEKDVKVEGINFVITQFKSAKTKDSKHLSDATEVILEDTYKEMQKLFADVKAEELWEMMGVTVTIGENVFDEVFEIEDAEEVAQYALSKDMGYVGYQFIGEDTKEKAYAKAFAKYLIDNQAPEAPIDVKPAFVSFDQVVLEWDVVKGTEVPVAYQVYRQTGDQKMVELVGKVTDKKYVDTQVVPDMKYTYYITALDEVGNESADSKACVVKTEKDNLSQVSIRPLTDKDVTTTELTLTWDKVKGAEYYSVYRDGKKITETKETTYTDKGLTPDTTYYYVVKAIDEDHDVIAISKTFKGTTDKVDEEGKPVDPSQGNYKGHWRAGTSYQAGDIVKYQNAYYICTQAHQSVGGWQPVNVPAIWNRVPGEAEDIGNSVGDKDKDKDKLEDLLNANGKAWAPQVAYKVGDFVSYKGKWYTCIQAHTAHDVNWTPDAIESLWGVFEGDAEDLEFFGIK